MRLACTGMEIRPREDTLGADSVTLNPSFLYVAVLSPTGRRAGTTSFGFVSQSRAACRRALASLDTGTCGCELGGSAGGSEGAGGSTSAGSCCFTSASSSKLISDESAPPFSAGGWRLFLSLLTHSGLNWRKSRRLRWLSLRLRRLSLRRELNHNRRSEELLVLSVAASIGGAANE